ncbi:Amino acid/polyamine transporter I [Penicillium atrosanguineum]|uniref:Amino acid/polyamine transporter I n=1 Tax=Penicillium atrosanguineum TaxID=1132637 RepID=UPI0023A320AF|nr:Amino acid/polyamine transporter I [Penicillium atrosanguineum]KAJ5304277.1 Amino acid/polyamine transporter I [Penicillium atrosanguineum]
MATGFSATPRKEGTWTKLVIFVSLYCLILESILEWVLVLFLYGNHYVDSKMTLSLVLALVSSFLSVPLVSLQSLVAWQYNKIGGFGEKKTVLHNVCTYVYRLCLMLWLATCVTGLVVAAQQVYCLPSGTDATYWRVGISCAFHRASVIVAVVTMITVCTLYCARELCDRPYDVSLIGIYKRKPRQILEDGSIFSGHSWDSDETLKNEILNLCRQHDGKANGEPWYIDPLANKVNCHPSIKNPAPIRLRPQLTVNTDPGSIYGEIISGVTVSPDDTWPRHSPGSQTAASDFYPISRTSTVLTTDSRHLLSDTIVPKVPPIPEQYTGHPTHKRGKSSLSSLRRFLPKSFPLSLPLSSDPQIRALADPNAASDVEKQVVTPSINNGTESSTKEVTSNSSDSSLQSPGVQTTTPTTFVAARSEGHMRTMTMNSADAPEVVPAQVLPTEPAKVHRSQTTSFSIHHPHHPKYIPGPANPRSYSMACRQNTTILPAHTDTRRSNSRQAPLMQMPIRSNSYQFDQPYIPRHSQSQYQQVYYSQPTRWGSQHMYDPSRSTPSLSAVSRRNDVEIIYPSTRRARSSTHGGPSGPLSCIQESTDPRFSVDSHRISAAVSQSTYRGANRTSMAFH